MFTFNNTPLRLGLECACIFIVMPLLILWIGSIMLMFMALWAISIVCYFILRRQYKVEVRSELAAGAVTKPAMKLLLARFGVIAIAIALFTYWYEPERWLGFASEKPALWALVMVAYPMLSVLPQEIVYRSFFFRRYTPLFGEGNRMIMASALLFGFAHIILFNWIAVAFSFIGGILFALTYQRNRSLLLVTLEHSLYGNFIFTIGLGWYFY